MDSNQSIVDHTITLPTTTTTPSPDHRCRHEQFHAGVNVHREVETMWPNVTRYIAQVQVICQQCGMPFVFPLLGQLTDKTHGVSPDGRVALLHMVPARKDFP